MVLNVRKKHFIRRMLGYATHSVRTKIRTTLGREQRLDIGGVSITLPPDHALPYYRHRDPTYDAYAIPLLARLALAGPLTVIDVGANVGDTAAAVLAAAPTTEVVSVEGDPDFVSYLRRNTAAHADRARVVDRFVGPVGSLRDYARSGSTGGFLAAGGLAQQHVTDWVTPAELLSMPSDDRAVVWKSDVDGLDIHILCEHFAVIAERCEVIWFEYDPPRTLGDPADIDRLIELVAASERSVLVYDNLGRRITVLGPGPTLAVSLRQLSQWLSDQREGYITVPYLDLWICTPQALAAISPT